MPLSGPDVLPRFFTSAARPLLLAMALAAGLPALPAQAQPQGQPQGQPDAPRVRDLARAGAWTAYGGGSESGKPVCGVMVRGSDRSMHVKYFQGGNSLVVHVFKNSWRIPAGIEIPVDLAIDQNPGWTARAVALNNGRGIQFQIGGNNIARFESLFRAGNSMRLRFMEGNEQPWVAQLRGSNQVSEAFVRCIRIINQAGGGGGRAPDSTQPFSGSPAPQAPTQPFGNAPPPQAPSQPFSSPSSGFAPPPVGGKQL